MDPLYADDEVERSLQPGEVACRDCGHPTNARSIACPDCGCFLPAGRRSTALPIGLAAIVIVALGLLWLA